MLVMALCQTTYISTGGPTRNANLCPPAEKSNSQRVCRLTRMSSNCATQNHSRDNAMDKIVRAACVMLHHELRTANTGDAQRLSKNAKS